MSDFYIFYITANIVCFIVFGIMLAHDLIGMDKRETQLKFDRALIAFMLYFATDSVWAAMTSGAIKPNMPLAIVVYFLMYVFMSAITYMWLQYVMAVEKAPHRNRRINRFAVLFPFLVSTIIMVFMFATMPEKLIDSNYKALPAYSIFLDVVPYIYIVAIIVYTMRKAKNEKNPIEKRRHIYIGLFPLMLVASGLIETIFMPNVPLFCLSAVVLMEIVYIQSMDSLISKDPLTNLNNRGQFVRYISSDANIHQEGRRTFAVMVDVNDFKMINDTFGHSEGDKALVIVAQALKDAVRSSNMPVFLGRYGGDEFVLVVHPGPEDSLDGLTSSIRINAEERCIENNTPYLLSVSIGYDELMEDESDFQKCLLRADSNMYKDKKLYKQNSRSTMRAS